MKIQDCLAKALNNELLSYEEGLFLINTSDAELPELLAGAEALRKKFWRNEVILCGIVNAKSGKCSENCSFCSQSAHHKTDAAVYPLLSEDELVKAAELARDGGGGCFSIVTSGRGVRNDEDFETILRAIPRIKGIKKCVSLGLVTVEQAKRLKAAGLDKFHHNLETARSFFDHMCTTHSYDERLQTIKNIQAAGIKVCCGGIFGIGESLAQRVELAKEIQGIGVDSVPINIVHPIEGTRIYGQVQPLPFNDIVRLIAMFRFMLPTKIIGVFGGRQYHLKDRQKEIFTAGANSILVGNYLTTNGTGISDDLKMLTEAGLVPTMNF